MKPDDSKPKFSRFIKAEIKRYNINEQEKCFADLMAAGWKDKDAYLASGLYNHVYSKETNLREMNTLISDDEDFRNYWFLARKRAARGSKAAVSSLEEEEEGVPSPDDIDMQSELSKENQLRELIVAKAKHPVGSKEWLEIKKMIADITQAKRDEIQTEDNTIHYYLPLTCSQCSLYKAAKRRQSPAQ